MALHIEGSVPGYNNCYHFHATVKYRAEVFTRNIAERLEQLLLEKSDELDWNVYIVAVDGEHVHFLIQANAKDSSEPPPTPNHISFRIFGYLSKALREEFPHLKEINVKHFWGGKQCKPIVDENHFKRTLAYIGKHKRV